MALGIDIVDGDIVINGNGSLKTVSGSKKVYRDLGKYLVSIPENDNNVTTYIRYNPKYGCNTNVKEYYSEAKRNQIISIINRLLQEDLSNYITMQSERKNISIDESIAYVDAMAVFTDNTYSEVSIKINIKLISGEYLDMGNYIQSIV